MIRPDADLKIGGDRIQMIETAKSLRKIGVDVVERVGSTSGDDYHGVDLVHLFNLQTRLFSLDEATKAKSANKPLALSTIWWEPSLELILETSKKWALASRLIGRVRAMKIITERANRILAPDRALQKEVTDLADILLPNSWAEATELRKLNSHERVFIVPNGVDVEKYDPRLEFSRPNWIPDEDYLLCAARIERLKGQFGLAVAARKLGIKCVLVGDVVDDTYAERCRCEGALTIGRKGSGELAAAYKFARLYVQPSLRETPGLASLEAAAMGCPVVTTKHGSTKEYFGSWAAYVDPFRQDSIEVEIGRALARPPDAGISSYVRDNFNWKRTAQSTHYAYRNMLES